MSVREVRALSVCPHVCGAAAVPSPGRVGADTGTHTLVRVQHLPTHPRVFPGAPPAVPAPGPPARPAGPLPQRGAERIGAGRPRGARRPPPRRAPQQRSRRQARRRRGGRGGAAAAALQNKGPSATRAQRGLRGRAPNPRPPRGEAPGAARGPARREPPGIGSAERDPKVPGKPSAAQAVSPPLCGGREGALPCGRLGDFFFFPSYLPPPPNPPPPSFSRDHGYGGGAVMSAGAAPLRQCSPPQL